MRGKAIICPYHRWSYDLRGHLAAFPAMGSSADFDRRNYQLYDVALTEWGGFVFVNLACGEAPLEEAIRPNAQRFANWPMATLPGDPPGAQ